MGYVYYTSNPARMQSAASTKSGAIDKPLVLEHEVAFKLIRRLHA